MSNVTTLAALREPTQYQNAMTAPSVQAGFFDLHSFELMQRVAKGFSSSTLVPKEYQGNVANTMIALSIAQRIGADPMAVMQQLYIVHGRPSWSSKFLIATFNACGRFTAMRFRFKGEESKDDWSCQAYATEKATGEEVNGSWVSIAMAKSEGWYGKNGSKWKTMPQQMLMYRAASFMVNIVAPELSMGLQTAEEAHDVIDVTPESYRVETLRDPAPRKPAAAIEQQETPPPAPAAEDGGQGETVSDDWPRANAHGELTDARSIPWDERIHSGNRACNADGTWRRRRGVDPRLIEQYEREALEALRQPTQPTQSDELPLGDDQGEAMTFEQVRDGLQQSSTQTQLDAWWQESMQITISRTQRMALEQIRDERLKTLSYQAA